MYIHMCTHLFVKDRRHLQLRLLTHFLPCFGKSVFYRLGAHQLAHALLNSKLKGSICLCLPSAGMPNACHITAVFFKDKMGEGLQACETGISVTKPSPQPLHILFQRLLSHPARARPTWLLYSNSKHVHLLLVSELVQSTWKFKSISYEQMSCWWL